MLLHVVDGFDSLAPCWLSHAQQRRLSAQLDYKNMKMDMYVLQLLSRQGQGEREWTSQNGTPCGNSPCVLMIHFSAALHCIACMHGAMAAASMSSELAWRSQHLRLFAAWGHLIQCINTQRR